MSGQTRTGQVRVGLIGAGIQRSKSPLMHMEEGRAQGIDLRYDLFDLTARGLGPAALPDLLAQAEAAGFAGVNVTHPCKQAVIPLLDALSDDARDLGAVNTVVFREGRRIGHNTDWTGFAEGFRRGLPDADLGSVLQLGAGGAGAAVAYALVRLGAGRLVIHDTQPGRAAALAAALGSPRAAAAADVAAAMAGACGLVNCTPVGMEAHPGLPLDPGLIAPGHWVSEIIYFPLVTPLLAAARARGCRTVDGAGMAVHQAVGAFRLFTGLTPDAGRIAATLRAAIAAEAG